ncbi:MAG: helix-turn-helix transcriptional regulator [Clostridia bacterium]
MKENSLNLQSVREKYDLSQRQLSKILNFTRSTISNLELAEFKDNIYSRNIKLYMDNPEYIMELLYKNKEAFCSQYTSTYEKIYKLVKQEQKENLNKQIFSKIYIASKEKNPDFGNTFCTYEDVTNLVMNLINIYGEVTKEKLSMMLWIIDKTSYEKVGKTITGLRYIKEAEMAFPEKIDEILNQKMLRKVPIYTNYGEVLIKYTLNTTFSLKLNKEQTKIIQEVEDIIGIKRDKTLALLIKKDEILANIKCGKIITFDYKK